MMLATYSTAPDSDGDVLIASVESIGDGAHVTTVVGLYVMPADYEAPEAPFCFSRDVRIGRSIEAAHALALDFVMGGE